MTNQNSKVQINYKLDDGTLINVYAENGPELTNLLEGLQQAAPLIRETHGVIALAKVASVDSVAKQAEQPTEGWNNQGPPPGWVPQQTQQPQYSQPSNGGPTCQHGPMVQRSGNKNGRAWTGWFCPTPQGTPNQCPPQFGK